MPEAVEAVAAVAEAAAVVAEMAVKVAEVVVAASHCPHQPCLALEEMGMGASKAIPPQSSTATAARATNS